MKGGEGGGGKKEWGDWGEDLGTSMIFKGREVLMAKRIYGLTASSKAIRGACVEIPP